VVFTNYAKFHQQTLAQKQKGNFLIYECNSLCGGYGNRIQGITIALMFAILSNRTFLIQMNYPFDINRLLHPNVIKWNYTGHMHIKHRTRKTFDLIDKSGLDHYWPSFSKELFNPSINIITFHNNLGFSWYFDKFDDNWNKRFYDWFNVTRDNCISTYGCVVRYLFTYDEAITGAIKKEMQELSLIPGLYVSVHFRSFPELHVHYNPYRYFDCAVKIANQMTSNSSFSFKVYLMSDSEEADKIASTNYSGQITVSHLKKIHVDRPKHLPQNDVYEGFIGLLVNVEVAAKGAVFIRSGSTLSDLIESIGQFDKDSVIQP